MSTNHFKFGTSDISSATRGGFKVGVSGGADYGPTSITGFYNGVTPPVGGYTIYIDKASQGPSIHVANNDTECINKLLKIGATGSTIENVLAWANGQSNVVVLSSELTLGDLPGEPTPTPSPTPIPTTPTPVPTATPIPIVKTAYEINSTTSFFSTACGNGIGGATLVYGKTDNPLLLSIVDEKKLYTDSDCTTPITPLGAPFWTVIRLQGQTTLYKITYQYGYISSEVTLC
jgi:hypothetical protein